MSAIVLDTNVISELVRLKPEPKVVKFLSACEEPIVSVIVFHEIAYGIERLRDANKKTQLELYLQGVKELYREQIVDVGIALAELAGRLRGESFKVRLGSLRGGFLDRRDRSREWGQAGNAQYCRL